MAISRVRVNERSSRKRECTIVDDAGVAVPLSDITVATLTLFDMGKYEPTASPVLGIINGRDNLDVLNMNNGSIHPTSGVFTWSMQPDDNPIVTERHQIERHRAELHVEFTSGEFNHAWEIEVVNLPSVS